jgi:alkaline phosphatase
MSIRPAMRMALGVAAFATAFVATSATAAPTISRLTPPSELFSSGEADPVVARFLPGQRFDLQATIRPDAGQTITKWEFYVNGKVVTRGTRGEQTTGLVAGLPANTLVASIRGYSTTRVGTNELGIRAWQSNGEQAYARGNFRIEPIDLGGPRVKNVIILLGDGMGASHRTAARIMLSGYAQGKARSSLAMDTFPETAMVKTASLNSIVTDSSPGMASYVTGNKHANNQEGVFPDDTTSAFDNPRTEYLAAYFARLFRKSLGIVTTADVFDATPASMAIYTANRGAGTGIADQYLDDSGQTGLKVLLGGGRKWFLPNTTPGSARSASNDYTLPAELSYAWGAAPGKIDPERNLIADFQSAGWQYAATAAELAAAAAPNGKLLGLFAYSNMNVALDKIGGRRGTSTVAAEYGLPDQPMLDEMTSKALEVLSRDRNGFMLLVEGASIDKQAHNMDSERWILDTIEFDRAIRVAQNFAKRNRDTLVIVTADHECAGATIIGASTVTNVDLQSRATGGGGAAQLRNPVVGVYEAARFPRYTPAEDGYPQSTDVDRKMLIGYGANADRYEDWLTNARPLVDTQQPNPLPGATYPAGYPAGPLNRDTLGAFLVTGQVPGTTAVHTGTDVPLSAYGLGAALFGGTIDNTDVAFAIGQAVVGGVLPRGAGFGRWGRDD